MGTTTVASVDIGVSTKSPPGTVGVLLGPPRLVCCTPAGTYATGGDTCDLSTVFPTRICHVLINCVTADKGVKRFEYIKAVGGAPATGKIQMFVGAAGADVEETNGTDVTSYVYEALVWGY